MPVIIVLLLGAGYFAVMETAFASASRIRLKAAADHGNRRAEQALYVLDHFDQAITTLLIGTNILHLTIATLVTVAVQRQWGMWAVTAGTLVTTVVVFFAGEMLPKSIAKKYAERLAMRTARSLRFFMVLFQPLSALLTAFGNAVARRVQSEPAVTVTEDELADIIENMTDDGELTAERGELMSSALSFADVPVESVITARVDVAAVDVDDPPEEILAYVREQRHSRLPVYADSIDNVIGILQIRKYIKACIAAGGKAVDVRPLLDEPVFVHQSTLIAEVLPELSSRKANLAIVTDNYGGTLGIVTVEDSNWLMSWTLNRQQQFRDQPKEQLCVWVYGLCPDKPGNYIKKPMTECTGEEICEEWLYHMGVPIDKIEALAKSHANTVPVMMPYITAFFMPRSAGDRPDVVPDGAVNFAFLGQFAETPRDTIFTTEYSMRTGMEAVYTLLDVDRGVPEVWGSVYDVRNLLNATVKLRDGSPVTDMKLNVVERAVMKKVLKKLGKTDIGMLLREYGAI